MIKTTVKVYLSENLNPISNAEVNKKLNFCRWHKDFRFIFRMDATSRRILPWLNACHLLTCPPEILLKDLGNTWFWMFQLLQENLKSFRCLYEMHPAYNWKGESWNRKKSVVEVFIVKCKIVLQRKPGLSRIISSEETPQIQLWWRTKQGQTATFAH